MPAMKPRTQYEPDGGVNWPLVPVLLIPTLLAAIAVAWCLKTAYFNGWYLILVMPGLGGIVLGVVFFSCVGWSHCRNRWLAGTLVLLASLTAYLGYFEFCLLEIPGVNRKMGVELLPRYIGARMERDIEKRLGMPDDPKNPKKPDAIMNWFNFAIELAFMTGIAMTFTWKRTGRAYCRELGQWMQREEAILPADADRNFPYALETGRLAEYLAQMPRGLNAKFACRLFLEYAAPSEGSLLRYPVYATLKASAPLARGRNASRALLRQIKLEPGEVLELRPLFPKLARALAAQHAQLRDLPPEPGQIPSAVPPVGERAQVIPAPEQCRQRVRRGGYTLWVNLIGLIPMIYVLGGIALAGGGVWLALDQEMPGGWLGFPLGAAALVWGIYTGIFCPGVPENRWIARRLRSELAQRPDLFVVPQDPETLYVSLIPREHFKKIKLTMAADLLLMKIDQRGRQIVMEGDCDRYRIPAGAIAVCEPQCFFLPLDTQQNNQWWMIRLMVQFEDGVRELLLSSNPMQWTPMTNHRRRDRAEELCRRINAIRNQD
ncbi:MAG: hypothetical protein JXB10_12625 [Pirellulales bacterium]|nr:hypothetical protein [Pirellulales bacterium]